MIQTTRTLLAIGAGLAWLAALVSDWMTIHGARIQFEGFGGTFGGSSGMASPFGIPASASSGSVSVFGVTLDIWLVVAAGGLGSLMAGLCAVGKAQLPRLVPLSLVGLATLYTGSAWLAAVDPDVSLGPGLVAASVGAALGCVLALLPQAGEPETPSYR